MSQLTQAQIQGKTQPFSRAFIPQPLKGMPVALFIQVPTNVSFASKVKIQTGDSDQGVEVPFARCVPEGCFADFSISDEVLKKFHAASGSGKLSFADAGGNPIGVPMSFNGFGKAYDALIKE
jgi:invasion protein IalB